MALGKSGKVEFFQKKKKKWGLKIAVRRIKTVLEMIGRCHLDKQSFFKPFLTINRFDAYLALSIYYLNISLNLTSSQTAL
jgi:hypothetical protein